MKKILALSLYTLFLYATDYTLDTVNIQQSPEYYVHTKGTNQAVTGLLKVYYEDNSTIKEIIPLSKGKINGTYQSFYPSGKIEQTVDYVNSRRNGKQIAYYENKKKAYQANLKNEKREGSVQAWYENGQLKFNVLYKNDKVQGIAKVFMENGTIESINEYKDDKIIKQIQPKKVDNVLLQTRALTTYGEGKEIYYLFVSPLCPHCKDFLSKIEKYKKEATFYIYLIPLDKNNTKERYLLDLIYSKNFPDKKLEALFALENGTLDMNQTIKDEDIYINNSEISKAQQIQLMIGVNSVPMLVDTKGFKYNTYEFYKKYPNTK